MSWLERCYQTYEYIRQTEPDLIGRQSPQRVPLFPVGHTTQQANIQVELDEGGNFLDARLLRKDEFTTIVPCTEESASRTHVNPHALADKLQYVASNYKEYGGPKKPGWTDYHEQLVCWCESPFSHPYVCAVLTYLEKGTLIPDLIKKGILFTDETGKLPTKYTGPEDAAPPVISTLPSSKDQTESFIRFRVGTDDLWTDRSIRDSWLNFYQTQLKSFGYCTVLGEQVSLSSLSPKKIRNPGDGAKLISSNDDNGFTYRGRFSNAEQALSIGYRTTQEAHNALRWLISKQGVQCGNETILVWGTRNEPVPDLGSDSYDFSQIQFDEDDDLGITEIAPAPAASTLEGVAKQFNQAVLGYRMKLTDTSQLSVIILDAATSGRLSVRYYRELSGSQLLQNIVDWHENFAWLLEYRTRQEETIPGKKPKTQHISFWGAPAPVDIAKAAYGEKADQRLIQQTFERLVPCITERKPLPYDLISSVLHRSANAVALESWEARKTSSIACALIRGYYQRSKGELYTMELDAKTRDRSYIFGQILACAEQVERYAQNLSSDDKRTTNAERMQVAFVQHPAKTTVLLQNKLSPYLNRIRSKKGNSRRYQQMLDLIAELGTENFTDKPLNELYLLGYATQLLTFRRENEAQKDTDDTAEEND